MTEPEPDPAAESEKLVPPPVRPRKRSAVSWLILLVIGGVSTAACAAAPHIGWVGWAIIIFVLFGGC